MSAKIKSNNDSDSSDKCEILLVEDSPTQLEELKHLIEMHGYKVITALNGSSGLEIARKTHPAIIISDIVMPEMNGYELCKAIRSDETTRDTPIVLLTSLSSPADVIEALKCGADNFIKKPYDERHLLLRIENILTNRKLRSNNKVKVGVELYLGGSRYFLTAEKQQILDLLISTYEQAVDLCADLQRREQQLNRANSILRGIYHIAKGLNSAMTQQEVIDEVLDRSMELPDVRAGWFSILAGSHNDSKGVSNFKLVGSRGLPPALQSPMVLEGDCLCRSKVLSGEINKSINILDCERLIKAKGKTYGLRSHVAIPLRSANNVMGILNLVGTEKFLFSDDDLAVLNGIGNQIGAALDRCRLHEYLEDLVKERTVSLSAEIERRKEIEKSLRESETRYRTLADSAADSIFIIGRDLTFEYINECGAKRFALSQEELIGKKITDVLPPSLAVDRKKDIHRVFSSGNSLNVEYKATFPGTGEIWINVTLAPLKDESEKVRAVLGISRDITVRKRNEETILQNELRLRTFIYNAPDVVYSLGVDGTITFLNPAFEKLTGWKCDEWLKKQFIPIIHPDDVPRVKELFNELLQGKYPPPHELRIRSKKGDYLTVDFRSIPQIENGNVNGIFGIARDITERKRAEEEIWQSEEKYRNLADSLEEVIYKADPITSETFYVNKAIERNLGYSLEEWYADPKIWEKSIYPADKESVFRSFESFRQKKENGSIEYRIYRKDKSLIWIEDKFRWVYDENGQIISMNGTLSDITNRKYVEEEITMLAHALKSISECVSITDLEDNILFVNESFLKTYGYSEDELIGKNMTIARSPNNLPELIKEILPATIRGGWRGELLNKRKDGSEFPIYLSTTIINDKDNKPLGLIGVASDISERKRAEKILRESEDRYRDLVENSSDLFCTHDLEGNLLSVNKAAVKTTGYSEKELLKMNMKDIIVPEYQRLFNAYLTKIKATGKAEGLMTVQTKTGERRIWKYSNTLRTQDIVNPIVRGMVSDITERKRAEEELVKAKELAEQSDKLKSEFLAQMSHEIRTPLNAIVGNADYLKEALGDKVDAETRDCFYGIGLASNRIIRTVDLILNLSELQTSGYKPDFQRIDLKSKVLDQLHKEHQLVARQKGLEFTFTCKTKETNVIVDEYSITQIFANLIDNAIKYTKKGKVEIFLENNNAGNIMVEIKDTGIGISKEFFPKIFEPFLQEEQGYTRSYDGSGLGLAVVKNYCEINNADIEVESKKNHGSTFRVTFRQK